MLYHSPIKPIVYERGVVVLKKVNKVAGMYTGTGII